MVEGPTGAAAPQRSVVRSSAMVAVGTALSRITGFGRLAAIAYAFGFTRLSDTYLLANTTPNIVYELLLGGVLSATLVPTFVEQREQGDEEATSAIISVALVVLVGLTVVGMLGAPLIMHFYTLNASGSPAEVEAQREVATGLLVLFMPQMLFYGLTTMGTALLNAHRRFSAPAITPVLNNVMVIAMLVTVAHLTDGSLTLNRVHEERVLAAVIGLGTTAGVVAMTVALWPSIRRAGISLRFRLDWRHPAVRQVGRQSGWTLGYVIANQVALVVIMLLAFGDEARLSAYNAAFVFFQLPHGLIAVSLMTTLVPELTSAATRKNWVAYRERFSSGVRLMALAVLPAATGYLVLARPIVSSLLERGALSGASAQLTAEALGGFAVGLFGFSVYLFTLRGFYALRDTRTPFFLNLGENALNLVLALALTPWLGVRGLALAYALAYNLAAVAALVVLRRRVGGIDGRRMMTSIGRITLASAAMAVVVIAVAGQVGADNGSGAIVRTAVGVTVGAVTFVLGAVALRVEEVGGLRARLTRTRTG